MKQVFTLVLFLFAVLHVQSASATECLSLPDLVIAECELGFCANGFRVKNDNSNGCNSPIIVPVTEEEIGELQKYIKVYDKGIYEFSVFYDYHWKHNVWSRKYDGIKKRDFANIEDSRTYWERRVWYASLNKFSAFLFMGLIAILYSFLIVKQFYKRNISKQNGWLWFVGVRVCLLSFAVVFPIVSHFFFYLDYYIAVLLLLGLLIIETIFIIFSIVHLIVIKIIKS